MKRITNDRITKLEKSEIFVFGSNLGGRHGLGAAKTAVNKFGAINGKGYGLQGKSFGIPTKDRKLKILKLIQIENFVRKFIKFAILNPDKTFLVTEIGCGLAGFKPKEIAVFFEGAKEIENIHLPQNFGEL